MKYLSHTSLAESILKNGKLHMCKINKGQYKDEQMPGIRGLMSTVIMCIRIK